MSDERVSTERVRAIAGETHEDFLVKVCRDLLNARRERDEAKPVLEAARMLAADPRIMLLTEGGMTPSSRLVVGVVNAIRQYDAARAAREEE